MPSFSSADQAPGAERTVIAYQPSYPVNQPGTIISYPMMSMPYPVDYGYYPVEQYQVLPGPSAGPSRSLETPPSYSCTQAAPSAAPTSVFTAPTPVVFAPAPSASTVVPVPVRMVVGHRSYRRLLRLQMCQYRSDEIVDPTQILYNSKLFIFSSLNSGQVSGSLR